MKKTFVALLSIVLCLTVLSSGAYAAEAPDGKEYKVELVNVSTNSTEMQTRGAIGSTLTFYEKTETYNITRNGAVIATVDCKVKYQYGTGISAGDTGITRVEFDLPYVHSKYNFTWGASSDYINKSSFRGTLTLKHTSDGSGCVSVFTGSMSGDQVTVNCRTTALAVAISLSDQETFGNNGSYELVS